MGDSASRQAVTRVNAEQASKRVMRKPTRLFNGEGRRRETLSPDLGEDRVQRQYVSRFRRGTGDGMSA